MNTHSTPMLTFANIWVYSNRATVMNSGESRQNLSRTKVTCSAESGSAASGVSAWHRKWLTKITGKPTRDKPPSVHQRTLIAGANGTLSQGQVTVLTGHSGSGKSVLLRVLAGLSPMTDGDVWLQDGSIHDVLPTQWRAQVALLAQHPQLLEGSVLDNLQMPYRLQAYQQRRFDIDWHITQLAYLDRTAEFLQQETAHLSGGERQLVNTLRLLQLDPQVLLLDEPTAALDTDTSAKLVQLLISWLHAQPQRALLWVTHDTQDIMPLADKHWHMQAGVLTQVF